MDGQYGQGPGQAAEPPLMDSEVLEESVTEALLGYARHGRISVKTVLRKKKKKKKKPPIIVTCELCTEVETPDGVIIECIEVDCDVIKDIVVID